MKQKLLSLFAALFVCIAFPFMSRAEMTITWNWEVLTGCIIGSDPVQFPLGNSFSNGGITLTANKGHIPNEYSSRRMYPDTESGDSYYGAEFTFSCSTANITRIEMTCSPTPESQWIVASGWSISYPKLIWSGTPAQSVNFGRYSGDVTQIVITTDEVINEDMLTGVFSVSPCKTVKFSKGNLQYRASDNSWQFANNQFEIIGNSAGNTTSSNRNTQSNWIDLYGWGTGNQPYKISSSSYDYSTYTEWGAQFDVETGWRTLTFNEWRYLLGGRYDGYYNQGVSFAKGTVNGVYGLILLPDDWNESYPLSYTNSEYASYSSNVISLSDWTTSLEAHGAVFLPATGYLNKSWMQVQGLEFGNYWMATPYEYGSSEAYCISFDGTNLRMGNTERYNSMAVRLVSDYYTKPAASISYTPTAITGLVYNGSSQSLINEGTTNDGQIFYSTFSDFRTVSMSSPSETSAGNYTVYYMVRGDEDHCDYTPSPNTIQVTIDKATPTITATPSPKTLYYTGAAQTLINAGTTSGGTMQYKVGSGSWSSSLPQATEIGDYTVYYKVAGNSNYYEYDPEASISVTIAPKTTYAETDANIETCLAALSGSTDVTINRTVYKDGYYNTICLPVDMSAAQIAASDLAGCELFAFDDASVSGNVLSLYISPADAIVAGVPYLIKWPNTSADAQDITLSFSDITIGATAGSTVGDGSVQYVGTIGRTDLPVDEDYLFVGANNTLYWSNNDGTVMKAFRAYFIVGSDPVISPRQTPARLVIRPKTPTAIESIETSADGIQKVIRNGQLIIIRNGLEYDAQGQKLK